jgi:uncharacterized membrane protein
VSFSFVFLLFILYSFLGWICEVVYCSLRERRLVNRGFLFSPICPVYGFGTFGIVFLLEPFRENLILLFILVILLTATVEYFTGWILETLFSTKWWDYSSYRFHLHGRICLTKSLMFGVFGVLFIRRVHPLGYALVLSLPPEARSVLSVFIGGSLAVDVFMTLRTLIHLDKKLAVLKEFTEGLRANLGVNEWFNEHDLKGSLERLRILSGTDKSPSLSHLIARFEQIFSRTHGMRRIMHAFPAMRRINHEVQLDQFKGLNGKANPDAFPASGFASGLGFYKLLWLGFFAGFFGVILEMVWVFATQGKIESRTALVFGMFNPLYGCAAVLLVSLFSGRGKSRDLSVFLGCMTIIGVFAYLCSLGQELMFGTVSWQSQSALLNLHGRTDLLSAVLLGFLGLLWVREISPALSHLIERIPVSAGKTLTLIILCMLALNVGISGFAVHRWTERNRGIEAESPLDVLFDRRYPDESLRRIYPDMRFVAQPILLMSYGVSW